MNDNFGVIISADYCLIDDINTCVIVPDGIIVNLKSNATWKSFNSIIGKIDIAASEAVQFNQGLFSVSGKIKVSRNKFENTTEMIKFRYKKAIVRVITGNGDVYVYGDKENPLTITHSLINPSGVNTASGVEYIITGITKNPELKLL